jgi:hypothetical protein
LFDGIILQSRRKLLKSLYIHLDNAHPHNARRSTESLHAKKASGYRTWFAVRTSHQVTSSSLVTSSENSPPSEKVIGYQRMKALDDKLNSLFSGLTDTVSI